MTDLGFATSLSSVPSGTVAIVPFFADDDLADAADVVETGGTELRSVLSSGEAKPTLFATTLIRPTPDRPGLLLVGGGSRTDLTPRSLQRIAAAGSRYLTGLGYTSVGVVQRGDLDPAAWAAAAAEGTLYGAYNSSLMKTRGATTRTLDSVHLISDANIRDSARVGWCVAEAKSFCRDLINLPPNQMTPRALAARASEMASSVGLSCDILDPDAMAEKGMGAILGVAAGSDQPARTIVLRYGDPSAPVRLALCGKGMTFDSGGLALKTLEGMETMKSDMSGAAAVIAAMMAIARLEPQGIAVIGYAGAAENMTGGSAMRAGDVLTAMNGETIEVLNPDAEGRLVLADLLSMAVADGATHVIDLATLTGAAAVALGNAATLAVGQPDEFVQQVVRAADVGRERAWMMPLYEEYRRAMDSEIADIKNTGGRAGGALNAAAFLRDFVGECPWTHLDIAGTAFLTETKPYAPKGATGEGVGTILSLVQDLAG